MQVNDRIYCDYQATTPVAPEVIDAIHKVMLNEFGNPHSSDHLWGWNAAKLLSNSQKMIAELLNVDSEEVIFTSGATESDSLALLGYALGNTKKSKTIAASTIEHKAVIEAAQALKKYHGWSVEYIQVDEQGVIDFKSLENALVKGASIISVMAVNNEIGTIQPIEQIANIIHDAGAYFHCDAAQAVGSGADIESIIECSDAVSFSGHKIYGPKGIGLLVLKECFHGKIMPLLWGGDQQNGIRPGTLPVHQIVGIAEALKTAMTNENDGVIKLRKLRDHFFEKASEMGIGFNLNGPHFEIRHAGNINLRFDGVYNKQLLGMLQPDIAASTGSACNSGIPSPSHVLMAIGLNREQAGSSVRFSFGKYSTLNQISKVVARLKHALVEIEKC